MVLLERRGLGLSFIASPAAGLPLRRSSPWCHPTALSRAGRKRRGAWGPAAFPQTASGVCLWALTEGEGEDIWALLGGFKAFLMSMVHSWTSWTPSRTRFFICSTVCAGAGTGLAHGCCLLRRSRQGGGLRSATRVFPFPVSHTAAFPWDFFATCSWTGSLRSLCLAT